MIFVKFILKLCLLLALIGIKEGLGSEILEARIEESHLLRSLFTFGVFWLSLNIVIRLTQYIYRKRKKLGHKFSDNVIIGLRNIYYLVTVFAFVLLMLGIFGLKLKELLTALSIVAAALAIISKELVMDVICGINLSFSRDIAIGDYVKIKDKEGRVHDLNIHKIVLSNNNQLINIPNSSAYFSDIINFSQKESYCLHLDMELPITIAGKRREIEEIIEKATRELVSEALIQSIKVYFSNMTRDCISLSIDYIFRHADKSISHHNLKDKIISKIILLLENKA
ncbi:MAG: mechanosensitive ion channel [Saprospiraceae bacterium]|nr:mechanosensitive ion channel [Saprospiraceae bacterium]